MKRKYFKQCFICSTIILSFLFSSLVFVGYLGLKAKANSSEQLEFSSDYEKNQKNLENSLNISIALGQSITDYEAVKNFTYDTAEYLRSDFYSISTICNVLSKNQTIFSNMTLNFALFKEFSDIVITSSTIDKKEFAKSTKLSAEKIIHIFDENTSPGYYYKLLSNSPENNKLYIACQRIYSGTKKIYLCITLSQPDIHYIPDFSNKKNLLITGPYSTSYLNQITSNPPAFASSVTYKYETNDEKAMVFYSSPKNMPDVIFTTCYKYGSYGTLLALLVFMLLTVNILAVILSLFVSKTLYKPIQSLMTMFGAEEETTAPHNEIEYISNSASMIIRTNHTLNVKLDKQQIYLKHKFIFDLLNGFIWGDAIVQNIDNYKLEFLKRPCVAALIRNDNISSLGSNYIFPDITSSENQTIFTILKEALLKEVMGIGVTLENNEYLFVLSQAEQNKQNILSAINDVKQETEISLKAVLSDTIHSIDDFKYIYSTLNSMYEQRYLYSDLDIITSEIIKSGNSTGSIYSLKEEQCLMEYLLSNESEKGLLYLNQLLNRIESANLSTTKYEILKPMLLNTAQRLCSTANKSMEDVLEDKTILQSLKLCENYKDFRSLIYTVFKAITHSIHNDITLQYNEITDRILDYIKDNLDIDLSMDDVSMQFGISKSTIARRLKERDILFKTFLNEQRIQMAKKIMQENHHILIKDVAYKTGFSNLVSFNRLFKKYEFISPKQYIDNLKNSL